MYFKTREVEEEDKEDDYSDSNSSSDDELHEGVANQDGPGDDAVELMEISVIKEETAKHKAKLKHDADVCRHACNLNLVALSVIKA